MVAITQMKKYEEIVSNLKKGETLALFTCNTCTRMYQTGGIEVMEDMCEKLESDGFTVSDRIVLTAACFEDYIESFDISNDFTTAVVLACDSGVGVVKRFLPNKKAFPALMTLGVQQGRNPKPVVHLEV